MILFRLQEFLTRHRRKFAITGLIFGGTYFAFRYAQRKLLEIQERQAREFIERTRRLQHFESTERTCDEIIVGMSIELCQAILGECSTDDLLQQLRQNPPNKVELWGEMKIVVFTRLTTLVYATSMLVVALRIKLNLIGGYLYRDFSTEQQQINDQIKQQYLSLINHFVHEGGLSRLVQLIKGKVVQLMKDMELQKRFTLQDLEQLFWSLKMSIAGDKSDPVAKMPTYLLPNEVPEYNVNGPLLQKIFNETLDLLESDDARNICSTNICRGFSLAIDAMSESFAETLTLQNKNAENVDETTTKLIEATGTQNNNVVTNLNNVEVTLAKVIPIISGLTSKGFDASTRPQNFATALVSFFVVSEKCKTLGANVYETFSGSLST